MSLQAKKSLGQHFLNSKHILEKIIEAGHITKGETILEIGPGTGILTEALLKAEANVTAIEKDQRAVILLRDKFKNEISEGKLSVISGDVLENTENLIPKQSYAIVANIPYYITGAILEKFLEKSPQPNRMVLLVQKEVADRIVAKGGKESVLSISVKIFGEPSVVAKVPKGAFTPPPKVDSAILTIENISNKRFIDKDLKIDNFFKVLKAGFAHKRKLLIRNLESLQKREVLEKIWLDLGLDQKQRAEDTSLETWILIVRAVTP